MCFLSFGAVLYSTCSLYAVIKMVLLDERGCHVQQELEASQSTQGQQTITAY